MFVCLVLLCIARVIVVELINLSSRQVELETSRVFPNHLMNHLTSYLNPDER